MPEIERPHHRAIGLVCILLPLAASLGGCAAAVAVPVLAAGGIMAKSGQGEQEAPLASERRLQQELAKEGEPRVTLLPTTTLPPPVPPAGNPSSATGEWQSFADFTLDRSKALGGLDPVASALLVTGSRLEIPDRLPCTNSAPAVIIDLDRGVETFIPNPALQPAPALAESLSRLREAGITVMWVSNADANLVSKIGDALRSSGLDPTGKDPLLLPRNPSERKQLMRTDANRTACILAVAGDRRSDFDELFDYLRDPDLAAGLDAMLGDGWFLVPSPLAASGSAAP